MTNKQKVIMWLSLGVLLLAGALIVLFFHWSFYPYNVIEYKQPFEILNEDRQVARGEKLVFRVEYEKFMDIDATASTNITCQDGNLVTISAPTSSRFPIGKGDFVMDEVKIPMKTSLDMCKFNLQLHYHPNLIREVILNLETEWFEVIE